MLPLDMGGVVDTTLHVYGTANVRVIDASVMPIHVTAHVMASAYAIAEYGADIVKMAYWPVPAVSSTSTSAAAGATNGSGSAENAATESTGLTPNQRTIVIATTVAVGGALAILVSYGGGMVQVVN
jgi:choline dehydrogenase